MQSSADVEFVPKHVIEEQNNHLRYNFPKSRQGLQKVESKAQLDQILRDMFYVQFQAKGINIPYPYEIEQKARMTNIHSISKLGFTIRCRICTNFLSYSKTIDSHSNMFTLQNFYSEHDHRLTQKRKIGFIDERIPLDYRTAKQKKIFLNLTKFSNSINDIEKCISELPVNLTKKMRQRVICDKFKISKKQFINIYLQQNQKKEIQFSAFIEDLHSKNYSYRYLPEDLLKENPKITRKFNQPAAFSVNPANHERKDDKFGAGGVNGIVPQINVDGEKNVSNLFIDERNELFEQPKTKGNFPLIDPNTHQIPKPQTSNSSNSQPTGLNGNNPNIPLYKINPNVIDPNNPNLPNVLLIISPAMKEMYKKYGQYMGFDLTFSLIRQQPTHTEKEYLVGVFASKNESFRIVIFGLVITNNQSSMVYKWLFKNFMQIMGKQPQTIITDEQVAIGKALKQLKKEGFYHGHHLLDTFHVLTKFRKAVQSQTFQYLRKLIHARDKYEYKTIFEECINQLSSDDEIKVLQDFDYHCQKYCYAHIPPTFVGFGVSDAMNESFHNILKDKIPYEIKYLKAVNIILPFLQQRNQIGTLSLICQIPYEENLGFPFIKPYRKIVSDRLYFYLINECSKGITHSIILDNEKYENHECQKIQQSGAQRKERQQKRSLQLRNSLQKSKFQIVTREGICLVWKEKIPQLLSSVHESQVTCDPSTNYWSQYPQMSTYTTNIYPYSSFEPKLSSQIQYKWRCICQMEEKSGLCCSHILKVLILRNESLLPYIHPRWFVREQNIFEGLKSMINKETTLKYVTNITTDMSNFNRLKYIRLRDKYLSARNNIKKELQEITDVRIPRYEGEVNKRELYNNANRLKKSENEQASNNDKDGQTYKQNQIQQQYMEWVSANDETIKMQKQRYFKILEKKRKAEVKRLKKEKGLTQEELLQSHKKEFLQERYNNPKLGTQYTDYVYLKPREMKDLHVQKWGNESQQQQKANEQNSQQIGDEMISRENNIEQQYQEEYDKMDDEQQQKLGGNNESEKPQIDYDEQINANISKRKSNRNNHHHQISKSQINRKTQNNKRFSKQSFSQSQNQQSNLDRYFTQVDNNSEYEEYENLNQYENQYQFQNHYGHQTMQVETSQKKYPQNRQLSYQPRKQKTQKLHLHNPFRKLNQQQPMNMDLNQEQNDQPGINQNQQQSKNVPKRRGRPRIHPIKEKPSIPQSLVPGQKKRGRPRKIQQQQQQISKLQSFSKLLEQDEIKDYDIQFESKYSQIPYSEMMSINGHQQYEQIEYDDDQIYYQ